MSSSPNAYFTRTGPTEYTEGVRTSYFEPTPLAQGAWNDDELHMGTTSGLIALEQEAFEPRDDFVTACFGFDILGKLHYGPLKVVTENIRPGRTIELIQSTIYAQDRAVLVCRTWRVISSDTSAIAEVNGPGLTPLEDCTNTHEFAERWQGGYINTIQVKAAADHRPGQGRIWVNTPHDVVEGEETSALVHFLSLADTMNGLAPVVEPFEAKVAFPNVDLTIHMHRPPVSQWIGMATTASISEIGAGITSAIFYDEQGAFGRGEQALTVRMMG